MPKSGGGEVIPQLDDYTYDSLNRISGMTEWQYDASGNWQSNVVTQSFTYDRYGNRCVSSATGGVSSSCPTYTASTNRISSGLTYDASGNITYDAATGGTMAYDAENRMVTASSGGTYTYDGEGKRVKRATGGQTWWYVYGFGGELLAEYLSGAPTTVKKEYGYRAGQLLLVWDGDKSSDEQWKWLVQDHLGSTRMEADKSGSLAAMKRHDYAPFGEEMYAGIRQSSGVGQYGYEPPQTNVRQKFVGYDRDNETGLDYAQARYYANVQGRFTSADNFLNDTDPADPSSWNLYTYVRNNPLRYVDPTGELIRLVNITGENRDELLKWLNDNYGCNGCVSVGENDVLQVDTAGVNKDVLEKAKFLTDAITDKSYLAFAVGYESNANINFAKAGREVLEVGGKKYDAILIDFKDFKAVSGDKEAVKAFTNYAFAHELAHLYPKPGLDDTVSSKDPTGPTENRVNELRYARGALLRATYSVTQDSESFGSQWYGPAKINKKSGQIERNSGGGIVVESKKLVNWNLRMTGTVR